MEVDLSRSSSINTYRSKDDAVIEQSSIVPVQTMLVSATAPSIQVYKKAEQPITVERFNDLYDIPIEDMLSAKTAEAGQDFSYEPKESAAVDIETREES